MKTGNRKFAAFCIGIAAITALVIVGLFRNVLFTGDNIERLAWVVAFMVFIFTGGNAAEWFSKKNETQNSPANPNPQPNAG
jgi:multisubunit Na+/H+ antiporter MnhE subunit